MPWEHEQSQREHFRLIGVTKVSHVEDAAKAARLVLSADEIATMESLADKADINAIRIWEKEMK